MENRKIKYGQTSTVTGLDDFGSTVASSSMFKDGSTNYVIKQFEIRSKVMSAQEEMSEYLKWRDDVTRLAKEGKLFNQERYRPYFGLDMRGFKDGIYFVVKSWTELV